MDPSQPTLSFDDLSAERQSKAAIESTTPISPPCGLYEMPSLCWCAEATREWFRAFTACSFSTCHPLRPRGAHRLLSPVPSPTALAFAKSRAARHSQVPIIRFRWDVDFVVSLVRCLLQHWLRPVDLLAPLADLTGYFSQRGLLLPGFRRVSRPSRRRV
jgi:hypothetical protein